MSNVSFGTAVAGVLTVLVLIAAKVGFWVFILWLAYKLVMHITGG